MKKILLSVTLLLSTLIFSTTNISAAEKEKIKVGVILPLSGELATFGRISQEAILRSKPEGIELIFSDDACQPVKTVTAFKKLLKVNQVHYIIGPLCGSSQQAIAPMVKTERVLAMLTNSAAEGLHGISGGKIFSPQYSNEDESRYNAKILADLGVKRAALVFFEDLFCRTHERAFREAFPGEIADSLTISAFDATVIKPLVARLSSLNVDGIYVPDVTPFLLGMRREMKSMGMQDVHVVSIYGTQLKDVIESEGKAADGIMYSYPAIGELDANGYFPEQGAKLLYEAIGKCGVDIECTKNSLIETGKFNNNGVLKGEIETREIKGGKFLKAGVNK